MDANLVTALAIGLMVFAALYLALNLVFPSKSAGVRKAKAIFAGAGYLLVAVTLWQDPAMLKNVADRLTWELIAVVVALLVFLQAALRNRS